MSSWNVNTSMNHSGSRSMVGGKNKVLHLNNDSDYGGIRGTFSSIPWRDRRWFKMMELWSRIICQYPIDSDQCISINACSPMPKLVVHAHIYVYWKGQVTDSNLLDCVGRYWCCDISREPHHCISPNTCSHMLKFAVCACIYVYGKGQVTYFHFLYHVWRCWHFHDSM